jgi:hypothetical protein
LPSAVPVDILNNCFATANNCLIDEIAQLAGQLVPVLSIYSSIKKYFCCNLSDSNNFNNRGWQ